MSIGKRLRKAIKDANMKMTDFSKYSDIPYRTIQEYIYDNRMPGGESLLKICTNLSISMDWLMTGEGEIYKEKPIQKEKPTQFESELFLNWLNEWWEKTDEKHRNWFSVQIKRCFPEYAEWLALKEKLDQEKSRH